jgi:hypothetical protein
MRRSFLLAAGLLLVGAVLTAGCAKRIAVDIDQVDLQSGRPMRLSFVDGSTLEGRMVRGAPVQFTRNDSLFMADIDNIDDDYIELGQQELLTDLDEWSELRRISQDATNVADRAEVGGSLLEVGDIETIEMVETDTRRIVTETAFWVVAGLTVALAAFTP